MKQSETKTPGKSVPRISTTTSWPRLAAIVYTVTSWLVNTPSQAAKLPMRHPVSSLWAQAQGRNQFRVDRERRVR